MSIKEGDLDGCIKYHEGPSYPSNPLSELLFYPVGAFMTMSYKRRITHKDLFKMKRSWSLEATWEKFEQYWRKEKQKKHPSLARALIFTFWMELSLVTLLWLCWSGLQYANPLLIPYLAVYLVDRKLPYWWGYVYLVAIWAANFMSNIIFNTTLYRTWIIGARVRSILINLIYTKSLHISPTILGSRGKVLNLMSTDAQSILDTFANFMMGIISPIQIIVTIVLLSKDIGVYALIPLATLLCALPFLALTARKMPAARLKAQEAADLRVKLTTEFISAIRIVKYYAWERPFLAKIDESREKEIKSLQTIAMLNASLLAALIALPTLALGLTIFFYSLYRNLGLGATFSAVAYLSYLRFPFVFLPLAFTFGTQYVVSLKRIEKFARAPEMAETEPDPDPKNKGGMYIKNGSFTWQYDNNNNKEQVDQPTLLQNLNLKVPRGKLVMVVGSVGSGKSSLANAFLKEMRLTDGKLWVSSDISYASQESFIINTTIRDNITFGQEYEPMWYQKVINACALTTDFELFPAGDLTEVTEKGSNLSGGQRQRINVARAMYSNRDIYIFDDPFSAVDAHVGDHMFQNAVKPLKFQGKAVLLITNQLHFLPFADTIAVLKNGMIVESGSYATLIKANGELYHLAAEYGLVQKKTDPIEESTGRAVLEKSRELLRKSKEHIPREAGENEVPQAVELTTEEILARDARNRELGALITKESSQVRAVSDKVYSFYFCAGSLAIWFLVLISNFLRAGYSVGENIWLSRWTSPTTASQFSPAVHRGAYMGLVWGEVVFILVFVIAMVKFTINSSRGIHRQLLSSIGYASTAFFDKTPIGRLIARFSKDMNLIDILLPIQLQQAINSGFLVIAIIVNLAIASGYAVIVACVAVAYIVTILLLYRRTSIQVQRLEAVSRAPIFTHFAETLEGLPTVRSYKMGHAFAIANLNKVDYNAIDFLSLRRLTQWFNLVSTQVVNVLVSVVILLFILFRNYAPDSYNVPLAVSACANSVLLLAVLGSFVYFFAEFEARMNAPERVLEYKYVEQEKEYEIPETQPPEEWPSNGKIQFDGLTIAYKPGVPVLHQLSATIQPKEKIGIVGRTGAGKSTLITALFRTTEPEGGSVRIDDIDISTLGLFHLRKRLSIIPQVPQLFLGTVRYNLDPFGQSGDEEIWKVLEMVDLKPLVASLHGGLDALVDENGSNFSVGQRQLFSMARCLLRDSRILLLDEATASLDIETDTLLQRMIRTHFVNRTVLTIAHRLVTIIDSTRVMVLDAGRIVEFDSPKVLLENKDGIFYGMVQATGSATAQYLTAIANGQLKVADVLAQDPSILESSELDDSSI